MFSYYPRQSSALGSGGQAENKKKKFSLRGSVTLAPPSDPQVLSVEASKRKRPCLDEWEAVKAAEQQARDVEALVEFKKMSKRRRGEIRGKQRGEANAMQAADILSSIARDLDKAAVTQDRSGYVRGYMARADLTAKTGRASSVARLPAPKFAVGQSVLEWWASWFTSCALGAAPKQHGKRTRPNWYVGEVVSLGGITDMVYAGVQEKAKHVYWMH